MTTKAKIPTRWKVPAGWVLTWYPPFTLPTTPSEDALVHVYDDDEPFVPSPMIGGGTGYSPNVSEARFGDFEGGVLPGMYALNIVGEQPGFDPDSPVHPDAIQVFGKGV